MLIQLLFTNTAHFALTVFSAFVFFAAGLLYLDAWQVDRKIKTPLVRSVGFFLLAFVAVFHITSIEIPLITVLTQFLKISGLALILFSLTNEPVLHIPKKANLPAGKAGMALFVPFVLPALSSALMPISAVMMLLIAATYFRKATEGLEKQLMPAAIAFFFLSIAEMVNILFFWSHTEVVFWSMLLSPFGLVWNLSHILEAIGIIIFAIWIWGYIRFRLQVQLFVTTIALSLILFLSTTVLFTFLLLRNLEDDALEHLKTDVNVLQYSLDSIKEQTRAHAQAIAQDSSVQQAFQKQDKNELYELTTDYLRAQKASTLVVASTSGEVIVRAEDQERTNDNLSADPIVKAALEGKEVATVVYNEGITIPEILVKAAVPLRDSNKSTGKIIGVVITGFSVDSAFVDGVKTTTGLDTTVFGKDKRAATTFIAADGKSRFVGTLETNNQVLEKVLNKGEVYIGATSVLNQPFYTAYAPLKTYDDSIVGMLFVGKLQNTLTDTAKRSIDLTFLGSIVLIVLSLIPAYFFARFLKENAEA